MCPSPLLPLLEQFCANLTSAYSTAPGIRAQPEAQLTGPVSKLLESYPRISTYREVHLEGIGRPDLGVTNNNLLTGYIELKPPGKGANPNLYTDVHDKEQWNKFKNLPNLLYTDGKEWALYRNGKRIGNLIRLEGDPTSQGISAASDAVAANLNLILLDFISWKPIVPRQPKALAEMLAPLCRLLRDEVKSAVASAPSSPLGNLHDEWKLYFFPDASIEQFADAYAQTLTYAFLLAHVSGAASLAPDVASSALRTAHGLLADTLNVLSIHSAYEQVAVPVDLLRRSIEAVNIRLFSAVTGTDPWLYFYEDFLTAYDPRMRKQRGVFYTPVQVVQAQIRLIDDLLQTRFNSTFGFVDPNVTTLDPACGTGTYLLAALQHGLNKIANVYGDGVKAQAATTAACNLHAFELLVGPYAVAHLRLTQQLLAAGGSLPTEGINVLLTDTLESPNAVPQGYLPLHYRSLGQEHERAQHIKSSVPILVCIGNPPYFREQHDPNEVVRPSERHGGWVRFGDGPNTPTLLEDFINPLADIHAGVHAKNLYNDYVYFWRWALWKAFEQPTENSGIISFITASSYLRGNGFAGMRKVMRETFEELWIIDLQGDNMGARKTDNVFDIQTPVCIAIGIRTPTKNTSPAIVRYSRITGTVTEKLNRLHTITDFDSLSWAICPSESMAPFLPEATTRYTKWPSIKDIFPWQTNGMQFKRTWPIGESTDVLIQRWRTLLAGSIQEKKVMLKESERRTVENPQIDYKHPGQHLAPLARLSPTTQPLPPERYAFRSFDRQWMLPDSRLCNRPRPDLQRAHGPSQIYMTSLLTGILGEGPAMVATELIPDLHHFRGSFGGTDVIPLYKDAAGTIPNITNGILELVATTFGHPVSPLELFAYSYGIMASPDYVQIFWSELESPGPHLPLTKDFALFTEVAELGKKLIWLHTAGNRAIPSGFSPGNIPQGIARLLAGTSTNPADYPDSFEYDPLTETLSIGNSGRFGQVSNAVWNFEVSGLKVVESWLSYRMRSRSGRASSPLDLIRPNSWIFDLELIHLLWTLEATLTYYPLAAELLNKVLDNDLFLTSELPTPSLSDRQPLYFASTGDTLSLFSEI